MNTETELTVTDIYEPPLKMGVTLNRTLKKDLQSKEARRLYIDSYIRLFFKLNFDPRNFPVQLSFKGMLNSPKINLE